MYQSDVISNTPTTSFGISSAYFRNGNKTDITTKPISCLVHEDCKLANNEYCSQWYGNEGWNGVGRCRFNCYACLAYDDAIDGMCPDQCDAQAVSVRPPCLAHDDCSFDEYCDMFGFCQYPCPECKYANYIGSGIDGTCPEDCPLIGYVAFEVQHSILLTSDDVKWWLEGSLMNQELFEKTGQIEVTPPPGEIF